jgi:hypothetical protein
MLAKTACRAGEMPVYMISTKTQETTMNITEARSLIANTAAARVVHITCSTLGAKDAKWRPTGNIWVASPIDIGHFLGDEELIGVASVIHDENEAFLAFLHGGDE